MVGPCEIGVASTRPADAESAPASAIRAVKARRPWPPPLDLMAQPGDLVMGVSKALLDGLGATSEILSDW